MHVTKLSDVDDGQTDNDGPIETGRRYNGREDNARYVDVSLFEINNGGICVP